MGAVIAVAIIVLLGVAAGAWYYSRQQRTKGLKENFGPEYERALRQSDRDKGQAEGELEERRKRVEQLNLRDLTPDEQRQFTAKWRDTQGRFVDDPKAAINEADTLVIELMQTIGYPMSDFEGRAADISVSHPQVVPNYRAAHAMAERNKQGQASTEEMRQALVHYRSLFDELLGASATQSEVKR
jgi:hypothetical protein